MRPLLGRKRIRGESDELQALDMRVHFSGIKAIDGVDLTLSRGEILGLIGPNGAGKTTLINALSGFQTLISGTVKLGDLDITGWPPHRLARCGLARTFQNLRIFPRLTALENVTAGAVAVGMGRSAALVWACEVLERMKLSTKAEILAGALPHGEERRLGVARALATRPQFILLDEPAAGLNEAESQDLVTSLQDIRSSFNCGLLIIEHDMDVIMNVCDRIQVLDYGKTVKVGSASEVRHDPNVLAAYLGTEEAVSSAET